MSDDRRRVLDLLAQGKVTVDEADQLLHAMTPPPPPAAATVATDDAGPQKLRWVRIAVHKHAKEGHKDKDVNIRVPIAIVRSGMRLGALIPGLAGDQVSAKMRERGLDVDFSKLDAVAIEAILKELGDTNIEIDSGRSQVRITCE
jgi:SHOCT-like domain